MNCPHNSIDVLAFCNICLASSPHELLPYLNTGAFWCLLTGMVPLPHHHITCPYHLIQVHYRSLGFYLDEHPDLLVDLLNVLTTRLDHARVVLQFRKANQLPLIKDYLIGVQKSNVAE
eukprot:1159005-Pelagomonas_calceolata.AAC.10